MKVKKSLLIAIALVSSLTIGNVYSQSADTNTSGLTSNSKEIPDPEAVMTAIKKLASAEVARLKDLETHPIPSKWGINTNWISATFFVGATKLADVADVPDVLA